MGNWLQRLEHTSEHTPGPWEALEDEREDWNRYSVGRYGDDGSEAILCIVRLTDAARFVTVGGERLESDPEAYANTRLMADAPAMLRMLAELMVHIDEKLSVPHKHDGDCRNAADACRKLLARHCRVGIAAVDAANHADKTEPPPPPPPPTLFDESAGWHLPE